MISNDSSIEKKELIYKGIDFNIYHLYNKSTDEHYLARISNKEMTKYLETEIIGLFNEINIVPLLNHPSIIKYITYSSKNFDNEYYPMLITDYCSGGLLSEFIYEKTKKLDFTQKLIIIYGIAQGMSYIHSHDIIHFDLKPTNIFLDEQLYPKIGGFNISEKITNEEDLEKNTIKGTPAYLAPEIYLYGYKNKSIDVFSYSHLIYELLNEKKVYEGIDDINSLKNEILNNNRPQFNDEIPEIYQQLISRCWSENFYERPSFEEIVSELENNPEFITEEINEKKFKQYINYIKSSEISYNDNQPINNLNEIESFEFPEFDFIKFKGIYETETANLSYFLKFLNYKNFQTGKIIGKGGTATTSLLFDKKTAQSYASKKVSIKNKSNLIFKYLKLGLNLDNICILKLYGISVIEKYAIFISKYYSNRSLSDVICYMNENKMPYILNDTMKLIITYGIASGMSYLHSNNIIHRNLKSQNILIDEYFHPKVSSFFCSKQILKSKGLKIKSDDITITTPPSMAPEFLNDPEDASKKSDVYSFALILYELFTLIKPFKNMNAWQLHKYVSYGERPRFNVPIPDCYRNLIERCWSQNPNDRPSFDEILEELETNQAYISENIDIEQYYKYINYVRGVEGITYNLDDEIYIKYAKKFLHVNSVEICLNNYIKRDKIGAGSFGKVYKVLNKSTQEIQACKIANISLSACNNDEVKSLEREINILSKLNFPSIIKFFGFNENNFKEQERPTFISELVSNGSLDKILELEKKGLSPNEWNDTKKLINIYGIALGMSYLHSLNILHRDLKPGNIFIDEYLFPKIGDFGLSKEMQEETNFSENDLKSGDKGTIPYMSPEILESNEYTKAGDVYAFAFIVYEILSNEELFKGMNRYQVMFNVSTGYRPQIPSIVPKCYKELIESCWNQNPDQRPTFDEIVENLRINPDFITDTIDQDEFLNYIEFIEDSLQSKNLLVQEESYQKVSVDLKLADDSYDENDPTIKKGFLDLKTYYKIKLQCQDSTWKLYVIKNKDTGDIYSAKINKTNFSKMSRREIVNLSREINNISKIEHPCILKFIGYSLTDFYDEKRPVIVTEYSSNGTISEVLTKERTELIISDWDATKKLINIYGIAFGMKFLHSNKILHRDLTPENIYLDDNLYPKIGNFGLSTQTHREESMTYQSTIGVKGSPIYSAPEVLQYNEYSNSSDVYSYGLIVYSIITGNVPFDNIKNLRSLFKEVIIKSTRPEFDNTIGHCYKKLIKRCWSQNANERPTFEDIVNYLETEKGFINEDINKKQYEDYIKYTKNSKIQFYDGEKIIDREELIKKLETGDSEINTQHSITKNETKNENIEKNDKINESENQILEPDEFIPTNIDKSQKIDESNKTNDKTIFIEENEKNQEEKIQVDEQIFTKQEEKVSEIQHDKLQDENEEFIKECIINNRMKDLIKFAIHNYDDEKISTIFDRVYKESQNNYDALCSEGILLNNSVSHYKYGLNLIFKGKREKDEEKQNLYFNESIKHFEESIHQGFKPSYFPLSLLYHQFLKDDKTAVKYANEGYELGDEMSKCILGYFKARGIGMKKDRQEGIKLVLSSKNEDFFKQLATDIGLFYAEKQDEKDENSENSKKAFEWFSKAYEKQKTKATINNYGLCFLKGFGVHKNIEKSIEIFEEGSKLGDSNSKYYLSYIYKNYLKDKSTDMNIEKYQRYNKQLLESLLACEKNEQLAKKYSKENDSENIFIYMNKCIKDNKSHIVLEYAINLYKHQKFNESKKFFDLLININHPIAKYFIGVMKYFGQGCSEDKHKSEIIMRSLSESGIELATEFIEDHFDI